MEYIYIIIALAGIAFFAYNKKGEKAYDAKDFGIAGKQLAPDARAKLMEKWVDEALRELNCNVQWVDDEGARVAQYDYQSGHFRLHLDKSSPYVRMSYLFCFTSPLDNLEIARVVANKCNINSDNARVVYSINEDKHEVDMHIISGLLLHPDTAKNTLADAMAATFSWQNALVRKFSELEDEKEGTGDADKERTNANRKRELFLIRQQEMRLQDDDQQSYRSVNGRGVTLQVLLDKALGLTDTHPTRLEVYSNVVEVLSDEQNILGYHLDDLAKELRGEDAHKYATAMMWTYLPAAPKVERTITFALNDEGSDGTTSWFRVNAMLVPLSVSPAQPYSQRNNIIACSVLMARDNVSRQQLIDESNYMWKEAVQKMKNGKDESLTQEQALIAACTDMKTAQMLYLGKKLFLAKRFLEALPFFENAYHLMLPDFDKMKGRMKETFYEVVYHIGFCYCDLKQYDRALGYLDMLAGLHRITYTTEQVNAMVNSGDFRSMGTIDQLVESINENLDLEEGEKPAEHIQAFLAFLNRRKAFILIDKGRLEEAKTLLNKMLEDPLSADYAINELAYIQKLEKNKP